MLSPLFRRSARNTFAEADPFESRVSARLAGLESGGATPATPAPAYQPQPAMAAPAARGFGRKGL